MTDQDIEQRLRSWYRAEISDREIAPLELRTDLATLVQAAVRSQPRFPARWRFPAMNRFAPFALAATAVAVVVLLGFGVVLRSPDVGPSPVPSPTKTVEPSATPEPTAPPAAAWTATGALIDSRASHSATLLPGGKVLVVGGGFRGGGKFQLASAEVYDPASGMWTATGSMPEALDGHTATLLSNGNVLVAGGGHGGDSLVASAHLYDPANGTWTATGSMAKVRSDHTATLLLDGTVLVVGGRGDRGELATAELYHPASGTWTPAGRMAEARMSHTATLLPDGKVLVAGGYDRRGSTVPSAELYDPARESWIATGSMADGRSDHTATLLRDEKVLVAGGTEGVGLGLRALASAELYDPASGTWTATGSMIQARSYGYTATLLLDGTVLAAGGVGVYGADPVAGAELYELYDPARGMWTAAGSMAEARHFHTATLLSDGTVLLAGGSGGRGPLASAELYDPDSGS